jgi:hypothetical protein
VDELRRDRRTMRVHGGGEPAQTGQEPIVADRHLAAVVGAGRIRDAG